MKCGIYPLNPSAVSKEKMKPSHLYGSSSSESPVPQSSSSSTDVSITHSSIPNNALQQSDSTRPGPSTQLSSAVFSATPELSHSSTLSPSLFSNCGTESPAFCSTSSSMCSPIVTQVSPSTVLCTCRYSIVNPLVAAGLIPVELSDILVTPPNDAETDKTYYRCQRLNI